jgi:NAD(P)H-dependent FMN reductase
MKVIGLSGSLRTGSLNSALLRAAARLAPAGMQVEEASIRGIPLYDGDLEREHGVPQAVTALKDRIAAADGLLLVTPEYNSSIPGVFKNAIDWLSRPARDIARVFGGKPVAIMGATPGRAGTRLGQSAWLPVLRTLGSQLWVGRQLYVAEAGNVFDADGQIVDAKVRELVEQFMADFADWISAQPSR